MKLLPTLHSPTYNGVDTTEFRISQCFIVNTDYIAGSLTLVHVGCVAAASNFRVQNPEDQGNKYSETS
jgi:hypothetical protein